MTTQLPMISSAQVTSFIKGSGSVSKLRLDTEYSGTVPHSESYGVKLGFVYIFIVDSY